MVITNLLTFYIIINNDKALRTIEKILGIKI